MLQRKNLEHSRTVISIYFSNKVIVMSKITPRPVSKCSMITMTHTFSYWLLILSLWWKTFISSPHPNNEWKCGLLLTAPGSLSLKHATLKSFEDNPRRSLVLFCMIKDSGTDRHSATMNLYTILKLHFS